MAKSTSISVKVFGTKEDVADTLRDHLEKFISDYVEPYPDGEELHLVGNLNLLLKKNQTTKEA